jgi:hypothetical protein
MKLKNISVNQVLQDPTQNHTSEAKEITLKKLVVEEHPKDTKLKLKKIKFSLQKLNFFIFSF